MGTVSVLQAERVLWMNSGDGCTSRNGLSTTELYT